MICSFVEATKGNELIEASEKLYFWICFADKYTDRDRQRSKRHFKPKEQQKQRHRSETLRCIEVRLRCKSGSFSSHTKEDGLYKGENGELVKNFK